jgi:hypothetical protein
MKAFMIAAALTVATSTPGYAMDSLAQFEWKNRVLILFGEQGEPKLAQQVERLRQQPGELAERDMVVLQVSGNEVRPIHGNAKTIDASRLRGEADIRDSGFHLVLVGKDGGIKLRRSDVVGEVEIFDLIDRMPMRRSGRG